jgi:SAM-dependent methyltransferase
MTEDPRTRSGSADRFGFSWHIFREILPEHHEQFLRWSAALPRSAWQGARFLDAGCGTGRNSHWAMIEGASGGVAIDLDDHSLDVTRANLGRYPTIEVRRQSIYDMPEENVFDVVFSIGVIHHLEEPAVAVKRLVRAARPGGYVLIWVYGEENMGWLVRIFDPVRRVLLGRMPLHVVYHLSFYLTSLVWLALRLGFGRLEYYQLLRRFPFLQLRVIVFDQMIPRISHYWSRAMVEKLMFEAELEDVRLIFVNEMSWSASGRKPPAAPSWPPTGLLGNTVAKQAPIAPPIDPR